MTTARHRSLLALALVAATLAGCAARGEFPSLAMRPAEGESAIEEPDRPPAPVAPDPALGRRVAALTAEAEAGANDFAAAYPATASAVAAAGPNGSDSWIDAQVAVSRLEAARGRMGGALADLNQLALDRADAATDDADFNALLAAIDRLTARSAADQERLNALKARLGS